VGIALLSYNGAIDVGLLGDADRARDLPLLARSIPEALAELTDVAAATTMSTASEPTDVAAATDVAATDVAATDVAAADVAATDVAAANVAATDVAAATVTLRQPP
jgi:hypothetical protein